MFCAARAFLNIFDWINFCVTAVNRVDGRENVELNMNSIVNCQCLSNTAIWTKKYYTFIALHCFGVILMAHEQIRTIDFGKVFGHFC